MLFGKAVTLELSVVGGSRTVEQELNCYHAQKPMKFTSGYKAINPFEWWKEHEDEFPWMVMLARRYLCVMATSVSCERVFSTCG